MRSSFVDDKEFSVADGRSTTVSIHVERLGVFNARSLQIGERMKHVFLFPYMIANILFTVILPSLITNY